MARPRRVVRGAYYFISRRTCQRLFRLRPSLMTNEIFRYCLAYAAKKTGMRIHAYIVMSNHHHIVVHDRDGRFPEFLQLLHMHGAKSINASQGQWECLWASEQTSVVRLATYQDVLDYIAYVAANPVEAGLVRSPNDWPGVIHWLPTTLEVERPKRYFSSKFAERLKLKIEQPACADVSLERWRAMVTEAVEERVRQARARVRESGRSFLGPDRVRKGSFGAKAKTFERRRGLKPRVAAKDVDVRTALIAVEKWFQAAYREALRVWRAGNRDVAFPHGTWLMRLQHCACVAAP